MSNFFKKTAIDKIVLIFISIIQLVSNGQPIYLNIFKYNYPEGIRLFQWLNFILGFLSILVLLIIFSAGRKLSLVKQKIILIGFILLNLVFIIIHWFNFFK
jgi:hypothetical protein